MEEIDKGWWSVIGEKMMTVFPEFPGLVIVLLGFLVRYWAKKGGEWMYETGGPGVFSNITWIRNTFGEQVAKNYNVFIAWGIIFGGFLFCLAGLFIRYALYDASNK